VRIQLYTVPGQVMYNSTRRLVLKGVDGVVFVADSLVDRRKKNIVSLKNLHENLLSYQKNIFKVPLVLQFNKRDIGQNGIPILSQEIMNTDLNSRLKVPTFLASATQGANVVNTLKSIIKLTVTAVEANILQGEQRVKNS
jgi:signal recognition particle receptor subunit beta